MKRLLLSITFLTASTALAADTLPERKAGLWQIDVTGGPGQTSTMKQCIDATTDAKMMQMGNDAVSKMGGSCAKNGVRKEGATYIAEADCQMGPTRMISKTTFSGDFSVQYSGEGTVSYEPPLMGMSTTNSKMTAKWLGACEAGQQPGDIIMPGGQKMNINQIGMMGNPPPKPVQ